MTRTILSQFAAFWRVVSNLKALCETVEMKAEALLCLKCHQQTEQEVSINKTRACYLLFSFSCEIFLR